MFKIRKELMAAFSTDMLERFEERVVEHIKEVYAEEVATLSDDVLRPRVHELIARAFAYKIETEADVVSFVEIAFELGASFDTDPAHAAAADILKDTGREGGEKILALNKYLKRFRKAERASQEQQ